MIDFELNEKAKELLEKLENMKHCSQLTYDPDNSLFVVYRLHTYYILFEMLNYDGFEFNGIQLITSHKEASEILIAINECLE